ncbi:transposase [Paenibacillus larvae]|nr:transposase [Paenibacillus larvae]MDT2306256.1 transposase [Paenibacillus larvae]
MAQYQINVDSQLLHQLLLGNSQDAGVAKPFESVLNQVLQAQVSEQVEADRYERTENRKRTGMDRIHMGCIRGWEPLH